MIKFIILLLIGCAFGDIVRREVAEGPWDELIDQAIDAARDDIIGKHFDVIDLPNINKEINQELFGIPITLTVKINGGEFYNISTINRRGPVSVLQNDTTGNITISTSLGLDILRVDIKSYYLHVPSINLAGSLTAQCNSNAIEFSISLIQKGEKAPCVAHINSAKISKLGDFTMEMQPSGLMNWIFEHIIKFALNTFSSRLMNFVNNNLADQLNAAIEGIDICSYIPI